MKNLKTFEKYSGMDSTVGFKYSEPTDTEELNIQLTQLHISPYDLEEICMSILKELDIEGNVKIDTDSGVLKFEIKTYSKKEAISMFSSIISELKNVDNEIKNKFEKSPWEISNIETDVDPTMMAKSPIGFKF